jgi:hypothetical protein
VWHNWLLGRPYSQGYLRRVVTSMKNPHTNTHSMLYRTGLSSRVGVCVCLFFCIEYSFRGLLQLFRFISFMCCSLFDCSFSFYSRFRRRVLTLGVPTSTTSHLLSTPLRTIVSPSYGKQPTFKRWRWADTWPIKMAVELAGAAVMARMRTN